MSTITDPLRVLAISGSLRKGSYNTLLIKAAIEVAASESIPVTITRAEIGDIPLFNDDVRAAGLPPSVQRFRDQIAASDAILFSCPEYNYSVPGVLKNAIDWASRPPSQPLADKPFAVMGASGGMSGTMRAQYHLRQIAVFLDMHAVNRPEIFVRNAKDAFEGETLKDETTRKLIGQLLTGLSDWTRRLRQNK